MTGGTASGPPQLAEWLLSRVLDARDRTWVLGDLHEEHARRVESSGARTAARWYWRQAWGAMLPSLRRRMEDGPSVVRNRVGESPMGRTAQRVERRSSNVEGLWRDVRVAWRSIVRRPAYAILCVATLALAIGANAAVFGVMDAVLLRPLPYPESDRIVLFSELHPERLQDLGWSSVPNMEDWREAARSFESIGLFRGRSMAVTGDGDPAYVYGAFATPAFFRVFGSAPSLGRVFEEGDAVAGGPSVVVISHGLWQRRYGGDAAVLGRLMVVDGIARAIVGVMPLEFTAPNEWIGASIPLDVWVPFVTGPEYARGDRSYNVVGRLRPGVALEAAEREMTEIGARLARGYPEANGGWVMRLDAWKESVVGGTRDTLFLFVAAMALVLVVACANVGNVVLNRALRRRDEFAVRSALGAGALRVARAAVLESLLLAGVAGVAGAVVAAGFVRIVVALEPGDLPRIANAAVDGRVLGVTLLIALVVGVIVGAIPALHAHRSDVRALLATGGGRIGTARGTRRVRDAMAVAQLGLALAMLAGSLMVARAYARMREVSPGFEAGGLLTATVALSWDRVPTLDQRATFSRAVLERLRAAPGVETAAMINSLPLSGSHSQQTFAIRGVPVDPDHEPFAAIRAVSPDYARTMRLPLRGREFTESDLTVPPRVAMVNDAFVRQYLDGAEPFDRRLAMQDGELDVEIIGVVGDVLHYGLDRPAMPEIYLPYTGDYLTSKSFVVRTSGDPYAVASAVREAIYEVDSEQPLRAVGRGLGLASTISMADMVEASVAGPRFHAFVLLLLAALAVVLSAVGLFAVAAQAVTERAREIGVRVALGARRGQIIAWITAWSARIVGVGIAAGLLVTLAAGRTIEAFLFGASSRDPIIMAGSVAALLMIAAAATAVPVARALRVDPARVLRQE